MKEDKFCPECGDIIDTCERCDRQGCFNCEDWSVTSDERLICPECAAAIKEEYRLNTKNGKQTCRTCIHFIADQHFEDDGTCKIHYSEAKIDEWCTHFNA